MPRGDRAKQFMPFDALKGLKQALREKEIEHESGTFPELSDDEIKQISETLLRLCSEDEVKLSYYENGYVLNLQGKANLKKNDRLIIVNGKQIKLDMIVFIEKV